MKDFNSKHLPCHFDKVPRCYVSSKSDRRLEVPTPVPTESFKGGAMIYIKEGIEVKRRPDLESKMYESGKLETVFLEIINTTKKNIVFGCVYRHPSMDINSFNEKYLNNTIAKLTEEKKICYLAGDFNIDLLKSDTDNHTKGNLE